ncbi:hypothetical protein BTO30_15620 [Domibacillus antri]|uniref:Transposase n=1 Tax=Domibacillus antri TaxID=1714264 RepID=A0A1Q8Q1Y0_9BACI|nr:hypothetical protein BTO30_15620 [Domibacillus antri]
MENDDEKQSERDQLEVIALDQLVPQDHLVRKLEAAIDFSFIYPLVEDLYVFVNLKVSHHRN